MAIQLIDTATPQVGLKGGAEKINANFTDAENAASRLVGTNPENVPLNSDLPDFGTAATKNTGTGSDQIPLNSDLGNASLATVQTSATDTTAGALMAVGAFGLGGLGPTRFSGDVDTVLYGVNSLPIGNTATNTPVSESGILTCAMWDTDGAGFQTFHSVVTEATYVRRRISNSWSDWKRIDPQAFGLGVSTLTSEAFTGDCNTLLVSGNYFIEAAATNKPIAGIGTLSVEVVNATNTVQRFTGVTFGDVYVRTQNGGTWSDWVELWTEYSYQPQTIGGGLNVPQMMKIISGTTWLSGDTKSGSVLNYAFGNSSGVMQGIGTPSGTWLNIGNRDTLVGQYVLAVRIA